jgi:hypothetical protein
MQFEKKKQFKMFGIGFLCALILSVTVFMVYAQTLTTMTLTHGIYPSASAFTVFQNGATYYAKNSYGSISYSGANPTIVVNAILTAGSGLMRIRFSVGTFVFPTSVNLDVNDDSVAFEGESYGASTILQCGADNEILFNAVGTTGDRIQYVSFSNLQIDGGNYANTTGIYSYKGTGWALNNVQFYRLYRHGFEIAEGYDFRTWNLWFKYCGSLTLNTTALLLTDSADQTTATVHIDNSQFEGNYNGDIEINSANGGGKVLGIKVTNTKFHAITEPDRSFLIKPAILIGSIAATDGGVWLQFDTLSFEHYRKGAIWVYRGSIITINNLMFDDLGNATTTTFGVRVTNGDRVVISDITAYGCYADLVKFDAASSNSVVETIRVSTHNAGGLYYIQGTKNSGSLNLRLRTTTDASGEIDVDFALMPVYPQPIISITMELNRLGFVESWTTSGVYYTHGKVQLTFINGSDVGSGVVADIWVH